MPAAVAKLCGWDAQNEPSERVDVADPRAWPAQGLPACQPGGAFAGHAWNQHTEARRRRSRGSLPLCKKPYRRV